MTPQEIEELDALLTTDRAQPGGAGDSIIQHIVDGFHPRQRQIYDDPAPVRVAVCGRRWGKTYLGARECVITAIRGGRAWWVAPVYQIARIGWREILRVVRDIPDVNVQRGELMVEFPSGGEIYVRSAHNPDNLRGEGLDLAVLDEAAFIDARVLPENITPMLDKTHSRLLLIGTPYGRNWYYQEWLKGIDGPERDPDYSSYQLPTADNPAFPPEALVRNRRRMNDLEYRQEHEAEFLAYSGLIYPEFNRRIHVQPTAARTFPDYVGGVDWGFANPTVLLVFGIDSDGRMHLVHEEYERQTHIEEWAQVAAQLQQRYRCFAWFCDPSEPDFIRIFNDHHVPAVEANNEVLPGIHAIKSRLEVAADGKPRLTIDEECIHTAMEYESYMWMEHSKDGLRDKPRKANDHAMDAMRYAVKGVDEYFGVGTEGSLIHETDAPIGGWW